MAIRGIKRYAAEHDTGLYWKGKGKQLPDTGKKVCIVGAGPAGMTAAYYLRKQGHDVTIKEALPSVGGMMLTVFLHIGFRELLYWRKQK